MRNGGHCLINITVFPLSFYYSTIQAQIILGKPDIPEMIASLHNYSTNRFHFTASWPRLLPVITWSEQPQKSHLRPHLPGSNYSQSWACLGSTCTLGTAYLIIPLAYIIVMLHNLVEQVSRELWLPEENKCSLLFSTSSFLNFPLYCDCSSAADMMPALPTGVKTCC